MIPPRTWYFKKSTLQLTSFVFFILAIISIGFPVCGSVNNTPDIANQIHPDMNITTYEDRGKTLMAERNWSGLISLTREGLAIYPYDPELLCLEAYAMRKTGHYQESVDLISLAIPNDTRPVRYANRGFGYLAMGRTQDAINDADSALALNSSYTTALALKADALRYQGNLSEAGDLIGQAIALDPNNPFFHHLKGGIRADMGDCQGAIDAYRQSIAINPHYDLPWPGLKNATADLETTEKKCARQAISTPPTKASIPVGTVIAAGLVALLLVSRKRG